MKILICGDRNWTDKHKIYNVLDCDKFDLIRSSTIIIHGACRGADRLAGDCAKELFFKDVIPFPANWAKFGTKAGPIRNREMLDEKPDLVIAFHSNLIKSKGTLDTVMEANRRGIEVWIVPSAKGGIE